MYIVSEECRQHRQRRSAHSFVGDIHTTYHYLAQAPIAFTRLCLSITLYPALSSGSAPLH